MPTVGKHETPREVDARVSVAILLAVGRERNGLPGGEEELAPEVVVVVQEKFAGVVDEDLEQAWESVGGK